MDPARPARRPHIGADLVKTFEELWDAVRAHHPEVPNVVITFGSGSEAGRTGLKLGHYWARQWFHADHAEPLAELFFGGEGLEYGAVELLTTAKHEAAHAIADVRGLRDTSRQGRWHNRTYKSIAEELGLDVGHDPNLGWTNTTLTERTTELYASQLAALETSLRGLHRRTNRLVAEDDEAAQSRPRQARQAACTCECTPRPRRIRVTPSVLDLGPILCGICGATFEAAPAPAVTDADVVQLAAAARLQPPRCRHARR